MAPGKRRTMLVRELARTREFLLSAEWLAWAMRQPTEIHDRAATLLMAVEVARLALLDAELATIRDELAVNEPVLAAGVEALAIARDGLTRFAGALDIVADLLTIIARIVQSRPLL